MLLGGWSLNPLFIARTGQPFSIFDSSVQELPDNTPRATFNRFVPNSGNGLIATTVPDTFQYITFSSSQVTHLPMALTPGSAWPSNMSGCDAFRAPDWRNLDFGLYKDTKITERVRVQRTGSTYHRRHFQLGAKLIF